MARGNQRDKAREKNQKAQAGMKSKNTASGTELQKNKETAAEIMRKKQEAGPYLTLSIPLKAELTNVATANAKKAAEGAK